VKSPFNPTYDFPQSEQKIRIYPLLTTYWKLKFKSLMLHLHIHKNWFKKSHQSSGAKN